MQVIDESSLGLTCLKWNWSRRTSDRVGHPYCTPNGRCRRKFGQCIFLPARIALTFSSQQDHAGTTLVYQCPLWDSIVALFLRPWYIIYHLLRYLILGDGWFRDYYMEAAVFTKSSFLDDRAGQKLLSQEDKDSSKPDNIPDIEIMTVSHLWLEAAFNY